MAETVDLLIKNTAEIAAGTAPGGPLRGAALNDPGQIPRGGIAITDGRIVAVGPTAEIENHYRGRETIDASRQAVIPGFVDCHTHTVFGGDRVAEFELRIRGASYMEIMAAGGGIANTVAKTRALSVGDLVDDARPRLDTMLALGSTTIEIKSGYGLDTENELKMLEVIARLDRTHPVDLIPTFLGAHTIPPEFKEDPTGYVDLVVEEMIPAAAGWYSASHFNDAGTPFFIDVFCEDHAFTPAQTARILGAGRAAGMQVKIHVDQFNELGGLVKALELEAVSVDHLEVTGSQGVRQIAASEAVAVLLPAVNFNLGLAQFADGRGLIDGGAAVALATDLNPGSAPCYAMPLIMAIACRYLKLTPAEALNAATINAAHALARGQLVGSLEPGKQADLLILKGSDYRHVPYFLGGNPVAQVIKRGRLQ